MEEASRRILRAAAVGLAFASPSVAVIFGVSRYGAAVLALAMAAAGFLLGVLMFRRADFLKAAGVGGTFGGLGALLAFTIAPAMAAPAGLVALMAGAFIGVIITAPATSFVMGGGMLAMIMTGTGHAAGGHFGHTGLWVGGLFALSVLLALYLPPLPNFQRALLAVLCTASAGVAGALLGWAAGLADVLALAFLSLGAFCALYFKEDGAMALAFHSVLAAFMMGLGVIGAFLSGNAVIWVGSLFIVSVISSIFFRRPILRLVMLGAAIIDIGCGLFYLMGSAFGLPLGPVVVGLVLAIDADILLFFASDSFLLWLNEARIVDEQQHPRAYALVRRPAASAGLPVPRIAMIDSEAVNLFSVGRSPGRTVLAVTRGLLDRLDDAQLEAVLAHELAHVREKDLQAMTMTCALAAPVGGAMRQLAMDGHQSISLVFRAFIALVAPFFALLLHLSTPRARETRADKTAVLLTRNSEALASALMILERHVGRPPMPANPASGPLFAVDPFRDGWLHGLFATHPPTEERIELLKLEGAPAGAA